ncbi:MAG: hypothetical protein AAGM22_25470, partial [Acidobacteriota bacterium]
ARVLDVRARDGAGLETEVTRAFIVDRTSPEIVIEGVEEAGVYLGPVAPVVSVVDEHPGSVTVTLDGIPMGSETVEASGAHTLAAYATDAASNSSVRVINFTLASVDGSLEASSSFALGRPVAGTWQLAADVPEIDGLTFVVRLVDAAGTTVTQAEGVVVFDGLAALGAFELSTASAGLGTHELILELVATSGVHGIAARLVDLIDGVPPTLELLRPEADALLREGGQVEATAADTLTGIDRVEMRIDAGDWRPLNLAGGLWSGEVGALADGVHAVTVRAVDGAGLSAERSRAFTIDQTPPAITIDGVEDGGSYAEPVTVEVAFDDAHPGDLRITLDGEPFVSGTTVDAGGEHELIADAEDRAGNTARRTVRFTITLDAVPPRVVELLHLDPEDVGAAIDPCSAIRQRVAALEVRFSEALSDAVEPGADQAFHLVRPGPDRRFESMECNGPAGDDVRVPIELSAPSGSTVRLSIPGHYLADDVYLVKVCGDLTDAAGNPLDGDGDGVGGDDFAERLRIDRFNLFAGGHFDCGLDGWLIEPDGTAQVVHAGEDFEGAPYSGSLRVGFAREEQFHVGQCVTTTAAGPYEWTSPMRLDAPAGAQAVVTRRCALFGGLGCDGEVLGESLDVTALEDTGGTWVDRPQPLRLDLSEAIGSAFCALTARSLDDQVFELYVDGVDLRRVDVPFFADGFESGDLSAWSATFGGQQ